MHGREPVERIVGLLARRIVGARRPRAHVQGRRPLDAVTRRISICGGVLARVRRTHVERVELLEQVDHGAVVEAVHGGATHALVRERLVLEASTQRAHALHQLAPRSLDARRHDVHAILAAYLEHQRVLGHVTRLHVAVLVTEHDALVVVVVACKRRCVYDSCFAV